MGYQVRVLAVGQHYKVTMSVLCHKSIPILIIPYMMPGCKTPTNQGKNWIVQCPDNVTEWDKVWFWQWGSTIKSP